LKGLKAVTLKGKPEANSRFENKHLALAVRQAASYAAVRLKVLEQEFNDRPEIRTQLEKLNSNGLDPNAFFNAGSVPQLLKITESTSGKLLAEVFRYCELDHRQPMHWRLLLDALVQECFRRVGAPEKWDEGGYFDLLLDIRAVQKKFPDAKQQTRLAKLLKGEKPFKEKYKNFGSDNLRKLVGKAMDPNINPMAKFADGEDWVAAWAEKGRREVGLPSEIGITVQMKTMEKLWIDGAHEHLRKRYEQDGKVFTAQDWEALLPTVQAIAKAEVEAIRFGRDKT
jgi:hypothetical protein